MKRTAVLAAMYLSLVVAFGQPVPLYPWKMMGFDSTYIPGQVRVKSALAVPYGSAVVGATKAANSAALEVRDTTKGVLIPRLTTTQMNAVASPDSGLMVYNKTLKELRCWNGSAWVACVASPSITSITNGAASISVGTTTNYTATVHNFSSKRTTLEQDSFQLASLVSTGNYSRLFFGGDSFVVRKFENSDSGFVKLYVADAVKFGKETKTGVAKWQYQFPTDTGSVGQVISITDNYQDGTVRAQWRYPQPQSIDSVSVYATTPAEGTMVHCNDCTGNGITGRIIAYIGAAWRRLNFE